MLFKLFAKIFLCVSLMIMSGCPSTTSTGSNLGLSTGANYNSLRGSADPQERAILDRMCGQNRASANCDRAIDPNHVNNRGVLAGPGQADDPNCTDCHRDQTPSRPAVGDYKEIDGYTPWTSAQSAAAKHCSNIDDASLYQCGRGVGNILERQFGLSVQRGDGHAWAPNLANNPEWVEIECEIGECPPGTVFSWHHNDPKVNNGKGAQYGHVEIVIENPDGSIQYCSDTCRNGYGGSVRHNPRRSFVYVGELRSQGRNACD